MRVNYQPALIEQIQASRAASSAARQRPVIVRLKSGTFVQRVDPHTRTATGEPQQFLRSEHGRLTIVHKSQWIDDPMIVDVEGMQFV